MRVLQVHNSYRRPGGEDTVVEAERLLLTAAGHDVETLIVDNPQGAFAATAKLAMAAWNPASAGRVARAVESFRPDVVHVHNTWFSLTSSVLSRLHAMDVPTVMTVHNYRFGCVNGQLLRGGSVCESCIGNSPLTGIRYRCYRDSFVSSAVAAVGVSVAQRTWPGAVDRFIATTEFARSVLVRSGLPPERVVVKPHHVGDPGPRTSSPRASRMVLYVGRLAPEKGVDVLVDAWRAAEIADCELVIVGEGPLRSQLEGSAADSIRFTGWLPPASVWSLMLEARALIFPSIWYETFGLVMVEALACGTPVLASDLGGAGEILGEVEYDPLVPPGDVESWTTRLQMVIPDDSWVDAAGRSCRSAYAASYTANRSLTRLIEIYENATGSHNSTTL